MTDVPTKRFSFAGYSFKAWLTRNFDTLKYAGSGLAAFASIYIDALPAPYKALVTMAVFVGSKLLLDAIHFYLTDSTPTA